MEFYTHSHELLGQIGEQEGYDQDIRTLDGRDKKDWFRGLLARSE